MKRRKTKSGGGNLGRYRVLRIAPTGERTITRSRVIWREHKRWFGGADIGPQAHHDERNHVASRLTAYIEGRNPELALLWDAARETGDMVPFFKAYRIDRHACFLLAGIHLAAQRRAVAA